MSYHIRGSRIPVVVFNWKRPVVDTEVAVLLHHEPIRWMSLALSPWLPKRIVSGVEDKVSVALHAEGELSIVTGQLLSIFQRVARQQTALRLQKKFACLKKCTVAFIALNIAQPYTNLRGKLQISFGCKCSNWSYSLATSIYLRLRLRLRRLRLRRLRLRLRRLEGLPLDLPSGHFVYTDKGTATP